MFSSQSKRSALKASQKSKGSQQSKMRRPLKLKAHKNGNRGNSEDKFFALHGKPAENEGEEITPNFSHRAVNAASDIALDKRKINADISPLLQTQNIPP